MGQGGWSVEKGVRTRKWLAVDEECGRVRSVLRVVFGGAGSGSWLDVILKYSTDHNNATLYRVRGR